MMNLGPLYTIIFLTSHFVLPLCVQYTQYYSRSGPDQTGSAVSAFLAGPDANSSIWHFCEQERIWLPFRGLNHEDLRQARLRDTNAKQCFTDNYDVYLLHSITNRQYKFLFTYKNDNYL